MPVQKISVERAPHFSPLMKGYFVVRIFYRSGHPLSSREAYTTEKGLEGFFSSIRARHPACKPDVYVDETVGCRDMLLQIFGPE